MYLTLSYLKNIGYKLFFVSQQAGITTLVVEKAFKNKAK